MAGQDELKRQAAERALDLVRPGMLLGLGSGSTAWHFAEGVGRLVAGGLDVTAIATSVATAEHARSLGIRLVDEIDRALDLAVDGADEIDPNLDLVKGRGGALLREKLVAEAAERFVVVADESKLVPRLGAGTLPVEVLPFLWRQTAARLALLGARWEVRGGEATPFVTDNGNLVLDLLFESGIEDAARLGGSIKAITGVVEHGLFVGLATAAVVAGEGGVRVIGALD